MNGMTSRFNFSVFDTTIKELKRMAVLDDIRREEVVNKALLFYKDNPTTTSHFHLSSYKMKTRKMKMQLTEETSELINELVKSASHQGENRGHILVNSIHAFYSGYESQIGFF